jgi:large subunit ribosomal protein L21
MKYAIVKLGGKQFKITEGLKFDVERQSDLVFDVLYYTDGKEILVGEPVLTDIVVKAKIVEDKKARKIRVARYKSKSRYRRVQGHKQPISVIEIESISTKKAKTETKEVKEDKKETKEVKKSETKKTTAKKAASKKSESSKKDEK